MSYLQLRNRVASYGRSGGFMRHIRQANHLIGRNPIRALRAARQLGRGLKRRFNQRFRSKRPSKKVRKSHPDGTHLAAGHSGISTDTLKFKSRARTKKRHQLTGIWRYQQNHNDAFVTAAGTQAAFNLLTIGSRSNCYVSTGAAYGFDQNYTALEQMNPYKANTGSSFVPTTTNQLNDRFMLGSCAVKGMVTNFSAIAAIVDIYVITPKILTNETPTSAWSNIDDGFGLGAATLPAPGTVAGGVIGSNNVAIPFVHPHDNSRFRSVWKICGVKSMRLEGNSTELVNFDFKWNKVMQKNKYTTQAFNYIPNVTYAFMVVQKGALVLDNTVPTRQATLGSTECGFVFTSRYICHSVKDNAGRLDGQFMVSEVPANVTTANQQLLNEVDVPTTAAAATT